jgi:RimJ/RimL family protein N-acetyltransferase
MSVAERLRLVTLDRPHLTRTREWANDPELMRLMDRKQPVTPVEHEAWFASLGRRSDCAYFAIETLDGGAHIGNVWLWDIDRRHKKAELRVVVGDTGARGHGLGSEAIDRLCRYGFDQLGLHRIYAYVLGINPAGRRAFERAGFTIEGTLKDDRWAVDRFIDSYLLARVNA